MEIGNPPVQWNGTFFRSSLEIPFPVFCLFRYFHEHHVNLKSSLI